MTRFAKRYGYKIEYTDTDPQGLLMGLNTGKFDMLATSISYTEERAQTILFSDPAIRFNNMLAIRQKSIAKQAPGLLESIRESYEKTFVREDRWKLIVEVIGTTCLITVSAAFLGTALAFGICMLRRTGSKLANIIADIYVKIMQGMPMVVLLLILYYVIFGKSGLAAVWVAIIGFALHFGANNSETLRSGIDSVAPGQREAALKEGMELLQRIGLVDKAENYPDELSGGQQQRVAIARAVAMHPKMILFDEPTSALNPTMIAEVLGLIRALTKTGMTMMIVTHEMRFARDVSTRVLYMDEGGIYEDGTPKQIFEHPVREKTRRFILRLRTLPVTITSSAAFDFLGFLSEIDHFSKDNMLSPVTAGHLQLVFEELIMQGVIPHLDRLGNGYPIQAVVEYSEADQTVTLSIRYGGDRFDPFTDGDEISTRLVRGIASETKYTYDSENSLVVLLSEPK